MAFFITELESVLYQYKQSTNKVSDKYSIIGATDTVFAETSMKTDGTVSATDALTETIDYGSDKATIKIYNGRGYNVYLTRMQIHGKPITMASGGSGGLVLDSLKRDDDIRRNGEIVKTVSNDYIFDATQVQKIADYWYKRCGQKKHLYSLQVKGSALWYEPGEWYTLSLGGAGRNEYISATVECVSVTVQRSAGGIGTTQLLVRECFESWSKTTLYTARLVTGASPKRRPNQSNTLIVASSSFDGTYDYRCDETDDNVQIQAAIDYLAAQGGGMVKLTGGVFNISNNINIKTGIWLQGDGEGTQIMLADVGCYIHMVNIANALVTDMAITCLTATSQVIVVNTCDNIAIEKINFFGLIPSVGLLRVIECSGIGYSIVRECRFDDIVFVGAADIVAIAGVIGCWGNSIGTLSSSSGSVYGISLSRKCANNRVVSASTAKYYLSYADAGTTYPADDTPDGGFNS